MESVEKMTLLNDEEKKLIAKARAKYTLLDNKNHERSNHRSTSYLKTFKELYAKDSALDELERHAEQDEATFKSFLKTVNYQSIAMANQSSVYKIYKKLFQRYLPEQPVPACPGVWEGRAMLARLVFVEQAQGEFKNMLKHYLNNDGKVGVSYAKKSDFSASQKEKIDAYRSAVVNTLLDEYQKSQAHVEKFNKQQEDQGICRLKEKITIIDTVLVSLRGISELRAFLQNTHNTQDPEGLFNDPMTMKLLFQGLIKDYIGAPDHPQHFYEANPEKAPKIEEGWTEVGSIEREYVVSPLTNSEQALGLEEYKSDSSEEPLTKDTPSYFSPDERDAIFDLRQQLKAESDAAWQKCDIEDGLQKDAKIKCLNNILRCETLYDDPDKRKAALSRVRGTAEDDGALEGRFSKRVNELLSQLEYDHGLGRRNGAEQKR